MMGDSFYVSSSSYTMVIITVRDAAASPSLGTVGDLLCWIMDENGLSQGNVAAGELRQPPPVTFL